VFDTGVAISSQAGSASATTPSKVATLCISITSRRATGSLEGSIVGVIEPVGIVSAAKRLVASALGIVVYEKVASGDSEVC
jgi:hypothetical protein